MEVQAMSNKMKIGLLSPFFLPISGYEEAADQLNVDLVIVTPQRIDWKNHGVYGLVYNGQAWEEETVALPRSLYNRYYGPKPKIVSRIEAVIGKNKVFNHITRFDKWMIHQLLMASPLKGHLPVTAPYTPEDVVKYLERFKRLIVKPTSGRLGTKIYLVAEDQGVYYLYHGTRSPVRHFYLLEDLLSNVKSLVDEEFLLQQYVPLASIDGRIFDVRLLAQKNGHGVWQISGMLSRMALSYSYVTNVTQAILPVQEVLRRAFPYRYFIPRLTELGIMAAQTIEASVGSLGELSVDLGIDENGNIWIIELNAKPMKDTFRALGHDLLMQEIYLQPLLYARHLATT